MFSVTLKNAPDYRTLTCFFTHLKKGASLSCCQHMYRPNAFTWTLMPSFSSQTEASLPRHQIVGFILSSTKCPANACTRDREVGSGKWSKFRETIFTERPVGQCFFTSPDGQLRQVTLHLHRWKDGQQLLHLRILLQYFVKRWKQWTTRLFDCRCFCDRSRYCGCPLQQVPQVRLCPYTIVRSTFSLDP